MAIHGYKGGVISATPPTTSVSGASGVWTVDDALQAGANWPVAPALSTNSVRTRASASAYMSRTPASASNRTTWTWSSWVKRGALGSTSIIFEAGSSGTNDTTIYFNTSNQLEFFNRISSSVTGYLVTSQVFRDPSAWYHIVAIWDSSNGTASSRMKLYINGVQVTAFATQTNPSSSENSSVNNTVLHKIGATGAPTPSSGYFDGYLTEINFIDGQALTPNYFGATDAATGVWQPATYRGTYGTNGFYLPMNKTVEDYSIDYLVVAGGGGGGATRGGGGGAGGLLTSSTTVIQGTSYTVTIGAGGAGGTDRNSTPVYPGNDSVFSSVTATGGGKGGNEDTASGTGGSGGGGGGGTAATSGSAGTSGQGSAGGNGNSGGNRPGGGGGGASAVGGAASSTDGGAGGAGAASSITGSSVTYAGGGGGGSGATGGAGGAGGGGAGGNISVVGGNGTANTGGGGGGGGFDATGKAGGQGGSGVVILRMLTTNYSGVTTGSPTVTTDGSYTVVKFTSSGSYTA